MGRIRTAIIPRLAILGLAIGLVRCAPAETGLGDASLADIEARGELVVLTLDGPTTYSREDAGPQGYEVDLATAFAESLGLEIRFETRRDIDACSAHWTGVRPIWLPPISRSRRRAGPGSISARLTRR